MKDEYIIINKTKWLEVLENNKKPAPHWDGIYVSERQNGRIYLIEDMISQSIPLIPEIEKAFDAAREFDSIDGVVDINIVLNMPSHDLSDLQEKTTKQDYISNLKLDIQK